MANILQPFHPAFILSSKSTCYWTKGICCHRVELEDFLDFMEEIEIVEAIMDD